MCQGGDFTNMNGTGGTCRDGSRTVVVVVNDDDDDDNDFS
jgi:hypothetical protein